MTSSHLRVMRIWLAQFFVAFFLLSAIAPAFAGVFSVVPVRIYMTPKDRAVAITLTNEGDEAVALQADINTWTQSPDGQDELVLTEDLILAPPIVKLEPKARQVVRLALLRPADASRQLTYRMIVSEVTEVGRAKGGLQVPISLRLSMPVFITPAAAQREMQCTASRKDAHTLKAICQNSGTAYAQVREVVFTRAGAQLARMEGGVYILPGAKKNIEIRSDKSISTGPAQVKITFDDGKDISFDTSL